jgi:hypothetical protein
MICIGAKTGVINAKHVKLISDYKIRVYSQRLSWASINHARETTGSNPISPNNLRISAHDEKTDVAYTTMFLTFTKKPFGKPITINMIESSVKSRKESKI